jgi:hypothetical protein
MDPLDSESLETTLISVSYGVIGSCEIFLCYFFSNNDFVSPSQLRTIGLGSSLESYDLDTTGEWDSGGSIDPYPIENLMMFLIS